jgi:ribosomal protein L40E
MTFEEANNRILKDVWICMNCGAKQRGSKGKKPNKCNKCDRSEFRIKHKQKKK